MSKRWPLTLTIPVVVLVMLAAVPTAAQVKSENTKKPLNNKPQGTERMHLNKVIAKLDRGVPVTGLWVNACHFMTAVALVEASGFPGAEESLSEVALDFVIIDMEHEPFDLSALQTFLFALTSRREVLAKGNLQPNLVAFVRIPADGNQPVHAMIKQVLDLGVHGIVVPHVRTADDARKIVSACRYVQPKGSPIAEPAGTRSASPWLASHVWGLTLEEYTRRADVWPLNPRGDLLVITMIEDVAGVRNIDEILRVKGVGGVVFGPYDYSFSCGRFGDAKHSDVTAARNEVKEACDRAGVPMVAFATQKNLKNLLGDRPKIFSLGNDVEDLGDKKALIEAIRANLRKP